MNDGSGFVGKYNGSASAWGRKESDFYPTPPDVTIALLEFLKLSPNEAIWEPACGDGAMARVLEQAGHDVYASDLNDTGYGRSGVDFLDPGLGVPDDLDAVITNPPFSHAFEFCERATNIAGTVALLLKSQYWHASTRLPFFRARPPTWVLPLTWRPAFLEAERGKSPFMDVLWTVWTPAGGPTKYVPLSRPVTGGDVRTGGLRDALTDLRRAMQEAVDVRGV